jgi:hypothetical protein
MHNTKNITANAANDLNIRLTDQNRAHVGQPHKLNAQLSVTTFEPLNYQLTTDSDSLGTHRKSSACYQI